MLNKAFSSILVVLLLLGAWALPVQAQDRAPEIRKLLIERDQEIKTLLGSRKTFTTQQRDELKDLINGVIDFRAMARTALGPHWAGLTEAQRTAFVDVFAEIVRAQSLSDLDMYRTPVTYETITVEGDSAHVATSVVYKEVPARVHYVLAFRDGAWRVDDIVLDDVSTAEGYARSFQAVVRKRGFDALLNSLQKKRDQLAAQAAQP